MNRLINVTTALGDRLRFSALSGREEISHLFDFSLTLKSEDDDLAAEAMLGTSVTLDIELPEGGVRYLNGSACILRQSAGPGASTCTKPASSPGCGTPPSAPTTASSSR